MLIFSDVDGTLLNEEGYCPLNPATLQRAAEQHQVVLASSRDVAELVPIYQRHGFSAWCIAEDGAVLGHPDGATELLGTPRPGLLTAMRDALSSAELNALLGVEPTAARERAASVLLPISVATPMLRQRLEGARLRLTIGGRWATITAEASKGIAARVLGQRLGVTRWIAIGNAANDATLLGEAWRAFVIRNPDGHDPVLVRITEAELLTAPGPEGWLEMLRLLDQPTGHVPGKERPDDDAAVDHHHPDDSGS